MNVIERRRRQNYFTSCCTDCSRQRKKMRESILWRDCFRWISTAKADDLILQTNETLIFVHQCLSWLCHLRIGITAVICSQVKRQPFSHTGNIHCCFAVHDSYTFDSLRVSRTPFLTHKIRYTRRFEPFDLFRLNANINIVQTVRENKKPVVWWIDDLIKLCCRCFFFLLRGLQLPLNWATHIFCFKWINRLAQNRYAHHTILTCFALCDLSSVRRSSVYKLTNIHTRRSWFMKFVLWLIFRRSFTSLSSPSPETNCKKTQSVLFVEYVSNHTDKSQFQAVVNDGERFHLHSSLVLVVCIWEWLDRTLGFLRNGGGAPVSIAHPLTNSPKMVRQRRHSNDAPSNSRQSRA